MKKINVSMYGGKGLFDKKETPYNVDVAYCDKCDKCDFYKGGTCFNAGRFKDDCKIGNKQRINGWTSKAIRGREFYRKWKDDECYGKLKEPKRTIGIVDDLVILNINCMKLNENNMPVENVGFGRGEISYIKLEEFTPEIIKKICDLRPKTIFDYHDIKVYYEEYIPKFLDDLKRYYPKIFNSFIKEYPEYDKEINYVGRSAFINSLKDGIKIKEHNSEYKKNGDYLIGTFRSAFLPFNCKEAEIKIKITKEMQCEITDNKQVDENTKFAD